MAVPFLPFLGKKGKSHMDSSSQVPWHDRPAREFPARRWLETTYGFRPIPLRVVQRYPSGWRPFPALLWLAGRDG